MTSGIYAFRHRESGNQYIGSSKNIEWRREDHLSMLRRGAHDNPIFQNAWDKYGSNAFDFIILDECEVERLLEVEQWWLDVFWPTGYNINPSAIKPPGGKKGQGKGNRNALGRRDSPERCEARSRGLTGRKLSPETIAKRIATRAGYKTSKETGLKIGLANRESLNQIAYQCPCGRKFKPSPLGKLRKSGKACPSCGRPIPERGEETRHFNDVRSR